MWVFCCGMMRSGSTLQYNIASDIVERHRLGRALGYVTADDFRRLHREHAGSDGMLVVKCHAYLGGARELLAQDRARAIYSVRDIRDVLVSLMHMKGFTFDELQQEGWIYVILAQHQAWAGAERMLVSKYCTMIVDMHNEVRRIAEHLGVALTEEEIASTAERFGLDAQKQRMPRSAEGLATNGAEWFESATLLHRNHIRSGEVEQWKTELTRSQIALIEHIAYDWLVAHGHVPLTSAGSRLMSRFVYGLRVSARRIAQGVVPDRNDLAPSTGK